MSSDKMSSDKMSSDKMSSDKMSSDKMSSDKMSSDKMSSDKMSSDKMSSDQMCTFDVFEGQICEYNKEYNKYHEFSGIVYKCVKCECDCCEGCIKQTDHKYCQTCYDHVSQFEVKERICKFKDTYTRKSTNHTYIGRSYQCEDCNRNGCYDCVIHDAWEERLKDNIFLCRWCYYIMGVIADIG